MSPNPACCPQQLVGRIRPTTGHLVEGDSGLGLPPAIAGSSCSRAVSARSMNSGKVVGSTAQVQDVAVCCDECGELDALASGLSRLKMQAQSRVLPSGLQKDWQFGRG